MLIQPNLVQGADLVGSVFGILVNMTLLLISLTMFMSDISGGTPLMEPHPVVLFYSCRRTLTCFVILGTILQQFSTSMVAFTVS